MTVKQIHIEKYDFDGFEKEGKPYVMIRTQIIQQMAMKHASEFLLWCFLESLPPTWKPNKSHLTQHFNISDRTYERYMAFLNGVGLIEYRQNRVQGGSFGKGTLIILDGSKFNMDAVTNGTVKIGGTVVNKKKAKVIHISDADRIAKFGDTDQTSTAPASTGLSANSPNRQITEVRSNDAHINTTKISNKERKKTDNPSVSVFSCTESVKTHLNLVLANRKAFVEPQVIEQGIYYAFETNQDKSFDSVNKRLNIFLKKVREGKWLIPQGFQGITSQSIREQEEAQQREKQEQYRQDALAMQNITKAVSTNQPRKNPNIEIFTPETSTAPKHISEGLKGFSAMCKQLKDEVHGKDVDSEGVQKQAV